MYVDYVKKHTGCWALQLLSLYCLRQGGYKNTADATIDDCVAPDDTGLAMDCACFTFLVIQYRVFTSDYFKHVVRDHREQSDMASRFVHLRSSSLILLLSQRAIRLSVLFCINLEYDSGSQIAVFGPREIWTQSCKFLSPGERS